MMLESAGDEVVSNAEAEHSHDGVGNDVMMVDTEVHLNQAETLIDDAKDIAVTEADLLMNDKQKKMDLCLSDVSFHGDGCEASKSNMDEITEVGTKQFSGSKSMCVLAHEQEVMDKTPDANGCENYFLDVAADATHTFAKEVDDQIEADIADAPNGNFISVEHEAVDGRARQVAERNGETRAIPDLVTESQDADVGKSAGGEEIGSDKLTVDHDIISPDVGSVAPGNDDVHLVCSSVGDSVPDLHQSINANEQTVVKATVTSSISQQDVDEDVDGRARQVAERNGETRANPDIVTESQDADVGKSAGGEKVGSDKLTVDHDIINPDVGSVAPGSDDVQLVCSSVGDSVPDLRQSINANEQTVLKATVTSSISQQDVDEDGDGRARQVAERNGETRANPDVVTESQDADVGKSAAGEKLGSDKLTVDHEIINPDVGSVAPGSDDVHLVSSSVGYSVPDLRQSINANEQTVVKTTVTSSISQQDVDEDSAADAEESENKKDNNAKRAGSRLGPVFTNRCATYELPRETADRFSIYDLVWGKVKSHPWWPGQIFHPSDSSEKAMKYHRKDCYLIAYFGDKSFAWNDASQLKPFRTNFSQAGKQSSSEAFQNAVDCALEEVSRRVELGLACSCTPDETYEKIKFQIVENAGIQKDSSKREGGESGDGYTSPEAFQPDKLVSYVKSLAQLPTCGANRIELTIAKAQLLSFHRLRGFCSLPEFQFYEGSLEDNAGESFPEVNGVPSESEHADPVAADDIPCAVRSKGPKRKHNLKDIVYHRRKEKSFSEIMGESLYYYDEDYDSDEKHDGMLNSPLLSRKRKVSSFLDEEATVSESTRTISSAKVSQTASPSPRQSFKIGDCIRRVASQLTGAPSSLKPDDEHMLQSGDDLYKSSDVPDVANDEEVVISTEQTSPDGFLRKLRLTAQDPMQARLPSNSIVGFFSDFRDAVVSAQHGKKDNTSAKGSGRKRKSFLTPESFGFDDKKDSFWDDMVVQNNSEDDQPSRRRRKRKDPQIGHKKDSHQKDVVVQNDSEDNLPSGRRRKRKDHQFDNKKDSHQKDRVVQNNSEQNQPPRRKRKRKDHQLGTGDPEGPTPSTPKRRSKKQYAHENRQSAAEKSSVDEIKPDLPTELILNFGGTCSLPSEANLNKMFRRFGPLKESNTEVDSQNSRARVVFKNGSDAKVAYSSAAAINIFGPVTVSYQLSQVPAVTADSAAPALSNWAEEAA